MDKTGLSGTSAVSGNQLRIYAVRCDWYMFDIPDLNKTTGAFFKFVSKCVI
jgi:hypothetical protein